MQSPNTLLEPQRGYWRHTDTVPRPRGANVTNVLGRLSLRGANVHMTPKVPLGRNVTVAYTAPLSADRMWPPVNSPFSKICVNLRLRPLAVFPSKRGAASHQISHHHDGRFAWLIPPHDEGVLLLGQPVQPADGPLQSRLELTRRVDLHDELPGGRRQQRPVHGERELAPQRGREVVTDAQLMLGLERRQLLVCRRAGRSCAHF